MVRVAWFSQILLLSLIVSADARDIYVDNVAGDDRRDGNAPVTQGERGGPCRTIERALRMAAKGDRLILAASEQPYEESITLQAGRHSGSPDAPFTLVGNGAVLDGTRAVPADRWEHAEGNVFRFQPKRLAHQRLFLGSKPAQHIPTVPDAGRPKLEPLQWCLYRGHIYFRVEQDKLPRDYELRHTSLPVGITIYEARHIVISDVVVQGFQLDGVNAHDSVFDATLVGLTCRGNGRSGISIGGASRVRVIACLVGDNGKAQVRTEGFSHTEIINSDLIDKSAPALVRDGGSVDVINDP